MEDSDSNSGSVRARVTDGKQDGDKRELQTTKPLHRFVCLGVVILIFGCAEFFMGFVMVGIELTSPYVYVAFWQGALFVVCGVLSIYTGIHPSEEMVTVCLSMYVLSLFGILFLIGIRIISMIELFVSLAFGSDRAAILFDIEFVLLICSLCVSAMLISLCCVSRSALKSTRTQLSLDQIAPPVTETPAE